MLELLKRTEANRYGRVYTDHITIDPELANIKRDQFGFEVKEETKRE